MSQSFEQILQKHTDADAEAFREAKRRDEEIMEAISDLRDVTKQLKETLNPIAKAYDGFLFSKSFLIGFSSVVLAIGAIGAGIIALVKLVK